MLFFFFFSPLLPHPSFSQPVQNIAHLVALQSRAKYLQAVREGRYTAMSTREAVEAALQRQRERVHAVSAILHRVCQEFPQHQGVLRRLSLALADHTHATAEAPELHTS